jgi:hypothetical protein
MSETRATLTIGLWFLSAIVLAALFIAAAAQGALTSSHVALASVMLTLATVGTITIWRMKDSESQSEKTKRRRLDNIIEDLSDDELDELKNRLKDNSIEKTNITHYLDDDGEIRQRG